jgi:hypothetical protein
LLSSYVERCGTVIAQEEVSRRRELKKDSQREDMPILILTGVEERSGIGFKSAAGDCEWLLVEGFLDKHVESEVLPAEVKRPLSDKGYDGTGP